MNQRDNGGAILCKVSLVIVSALATALSEKDIVG